MLLALPILLFAIVFTVFMIVSSMNSTPPTPAPSEELKTDNTKLRFRVVAFNKDGYHPSGYYTIEVKKGFGWYRVNKFLGGVLGKWNPVLEKYEDAKRLATKWKNDENAYNEWVASQYEYEASYKKSKEDSIKKMYPVDSEEV